MKFYQNQARSKQKEKLTVKLINKTETEEGSGQDLLEPSIYKEERVLRMMEEQEIPARSGQIYRFTPANRDDLMMRTGHPKYLPVDTCKKYGINCGPIKEYGNVKDTNIAQ